MFIEKHLLGSVAIVRPGGEIGIKSKPVRKLYEQLLLQNIRRSLKDEHVPFSHISRTAGRIYVTSNEGRRVAEIAARTFGVSSASTGIAIASNLETIVQVGTRIADKALVPGTFAVRCRRIGSHSYTSPQVEKLLGESILALGKDLKVDLGRPEQVVSVEIRDDMAIVYVSTLYGPDGYPLGSQETFIGIIDKSSESVLASWCMMKRGSSLKALVVTDMEGPDSQTLQNLQKLTQWVPGHQIRATVVRLENPPDNLLGVQLMLATHFARKKKIGAIVSSFHSRNLDLIRRVMDSDTCTFLPLVAMDNRLSEQWAKHIGVKPPPIKDMAFPEKVTTDGEVAAMVRGSEEINVKADLQVSYS